jgi:PPK2 family polyphosphate:nucleotide phosphotransferase
VAPDLSDAEADVPGAPDDAVLDARLAELGPRLERLQGALYAESRRALLIVLQGRDGSGKDGTIRHVFGLLNPQGLSITGFKVPTPPERAHDYLWRIHRAVPAHGLVGVFNRSHYEDALVPRVHGEIERDEVERRLRQMNDFERMLSETSTTVVKFFLHISREEQRRRLLGRLEDPTKRWKFNPDDLAERSRWDDYTEAYRDIFARTSTAWAPWYIVPADRKPLRNALIAETLRATLEAMRPSYPPADPEVLALRASLDGQ